MEFRGGQKKKTLDGSANVGKWWALTDTICASLYFALARWRLTGSLGLSFYSTKYIPIKYIESLDLFRIAHHDIVLIFNTRFGCKLFLK